MSLNIETFSNSRGGNVFYKALAHPLAAEPAARLGAELAAYSCFAVYDPLGLAASAALFVPLDADRLSAVYVQDARRAGELLLDHEARPIDQFSDAQALLIMAFDGEHLLHQIRHVIPPGTRVYTLDALRIPDNWLSAPQRYLSPLNFVTNFAFFRDTDRSHTRLATVNYWSSYGASEPHLCGLLFDHDGRELARFRDPMGAAGGALLIDSRELRERFALGDFCGQLFLQVAGAAGHDVFKYALDTYGESGAQLSCTHDANPWPAERYAGLPTPDHGETVTLWVQNSHGLSIPGGTLAVRTDEGETLPIEEGLGPWATLPLDLGSLGVGRGTQVEFLAGKHCVRPRYEIHRGGHSRIAHLNVVREDLEPDPDYWRAAEHLGKGFLLPAPWLPASDFDSELLITPMSAAQDELALLVRVFSPEGEQLGERPLAAARSDNRWLDLNQLAAGGEQPGHLEVLYDPHARGPVDGWLHAIFRYRERNSEHLAETSFGCHMFNSLVTYKGEPQSYTGPPPGLSTRLFLRLGVAPQRTFCHLIYPSSSRWHRLSETRLILTSALGEALDEQAIAIPLGGSRWIEVQDFFAADLLAAAGAGAYVVVRDSTCRLFGYHGLRQGDGFSLDHMFGF